MLICEAATACVVPRSYCQIEARATDTAKVLVWVRDGRGAPVSGLTADDFVVTENGVRDRVIAVTNFSGAVPRQPSAGRARLPLAAQQGQRISEPASSNGEAAPELATHVLLILSPMSPTGRARALGDAIRFLSRPGSEQWQIALLDDAGAYVPEGQSAGQLRAILEDLASHASAPQFRPDLGGEWTHKANHAIWELGTLPGRHAIVFVSDYESKLDEAIGQNPTLLRVGPTWFIFAAIEARAAMYTVQSSGPEVAVPFGGAASQGQFVGSGQDAANQIVQNIVALGVLRSDLNLAADETGGRAVNDLLEAFEDIAADGAGYYLVSFRPQPGNTDGAWHPVSVATRTRHLHVKSPLFYLAPAEAKEDQLPSVMIKALRAGPSDGGLTVAAHAWLFPDRPGAVSSGAFVSEVTWEDREHPPASGSRLRLFAEVIENTTGTVVGASLEEMRWSAGVNEPERAHWQTVSPVYPGTYTLKVVGMDTVSGRTGSKEFSFLVHPMDKNALRFSGIVLADGCLSSQEEAARRRNLLNPLLSGACELKPTPDVGFRANQTPTVLVRIYSPNEKLAKHIAEGWTAYAIVDDVPRERGATQLEIAPDGVRGLAASGQLKLSQMNLAPGQHSLKVVFEFQDAASKARHVSVDSTFTIAP